MTGLFDSHADLGEVVRELPPEHRERLTFHLPLEVQALEVAGASVDEIRDRINRRLPTAFAASLVDPPLFRWAESHYQGVSTRLLDGDATVRKAAFAEVAALGPGLAGGAFHALIRIGYGALRRDPKEIARGLAYLRVRRQVLFNSEPTQSPTGLSLPTPGELGGTSVFDQLDLVAGDRAMVEVGGPLRSLPSPTELCAKAMALVERDPSSFIAIHTVTSLHALAEIDHLITGRPTVADSSGDPVIGSWWRALWHAITACAVLVELGSRGSPTRPRLTFTGLEGLVAASVESCEVHDLKISVALSRLVELGVTSERSALVVGEEKLAATECTQW